MDKKMSVEEREKYLLKKEFYIVLTIIVIIMALWVIVRTMTYTIKGENKLTCPEGMHEISVGKIGETEVEVIYCKDANTGEVKTYSKK